MVRRSSTDFPDRLFGSLVYVIPLISSIGFGTLIFQQFPQIQLIFLPLAPFILIYAANRWSEFIIFFLLYLGVVRNEKISHFIRFNTIQALLIDILLTLFSFILRLVPMGIGLNLVIETLYNMIFLATFIACFYSIISSILGKYAEIPTISEVAYSQVRW